MKLSRRLGLLLEEFLIPQALAQSFFLPLQLQLAPHLAVAGNWPVAAFTGLVKRLVLPSHSTRDKAIVDNPRVAFLQRVLQSIDFFAKELFFGFEELLLHYSFHETG